MGSLTPADAAPDTPKATVLEGETGIKFKASYPLPNDEKSFVSFVEAGAVTSRPWWNPFGAKAAYAVGLYVDYEKAYADMEGRGGGGGRESLLTDNYPKTLRLVLAKETDTFEFTSRINDNIEARMAKKSYVDLAWLELWRNWLVNQGGYKQKLNKGVEIRMTWEQGGVITTEVRRRDKVLGAKQLSSEPLAWALFSAFLGDAPLEHSASKDMLSTFEELMLH